MIELISAERCIGCDLCIRVCPTDVFDAAAGGGVPVIARQDDCQTCFMCESRCPVDAMYVAPLRTPAPADSVHRDLDRLAADGTLGSYRARLGWGHGRRPPRTSEQLYAIAGLTGPER
ncbi:4Fe-4S binding protein [Jiangella endophytica]|uniref:4Fe-4S binding protein n=1 Tax=Jiangella endophytica TaxID=1623398 RepID=UPI000E34A612|nr:ferredoxin family protein [Jiangella endophytica]